MRLTTVSGGMDADMDYTELMGMAVPPSDFGLTVFQAQVSAVAAAGGIEAGAYPSVGVSFGKGEGPGMGVTFEFRKEA